MKIKRCGPSSNKNSSAGPASGTWRLLITLLGAAILTIVSFDARTIFAQSRELKKGKDGEVLAWQDRLGIRVGYELRKGDRDETRYFYEFNYNAIYQSIWDLNLKINGDYTITKIESADKTSSTEQSVQKHKMELVLDRWLFSSNWAISYLGSFENNKSQNIFSRLETGAGPKWRPWNLWWTSFTLSSVPVLDYTKSYDTLANTKIYRSYNRASLAFYFVESQDQSLTISAAYIPRMTDPADYRTSVSATLSFKIVGNLSWETTSEYEHVSKPLRTADAAPVKKTNYNVMAGIRFDI